MGLITKAIEKRYSLADLDRDMEYVMSGRPSATGINLTNNMALNCVPYFAGVRLLAETVGQVPLILYRRVKRSNERRGKERAAEERLYTLLHDEPNPEMDAMSFKSAMMGHAVTWGNAFAEIEWDMVRGEPRALWPLNVSKMKVGRDDKTRELIYAYTLPDGTPWQFQPQQIWHLTGFGYDGIIGYDSIYLAREAIAMSLAMEEFGARFFKNNARPGGILKHPNKLDKPAREQWRDKWEENMGGLSNAHRIAILDEGMDFKEIGIHPENAQFLESRQFQVIEIARLLNIPPHMLRDLSRATFSNIEHQALEFMKYTMGPWFRRIEQTCHRKLILPGERQSLFTEFLEDALLRADTTARGAFYKEMYLMSAMSPNDIREKENMNPIPDENADKYFAQINLAPIDMLEQIHLKNRAVEMKSAGEGVNNILHRIAGREKANILRAAKRDPENFGVWLTDFYRDFPDFIKRQLEPVVGAGAGDAAARYIEQSKRELDNIGPEDIEIVMVGWEERRAGGD